MSMLVHTQVNFFCLYGVVNPRPTITCTCDLVRLTIVSKKSKSVHKSITQSVVHELQDRTMTQDAFVSIESCLNSIKEAAPAIPLRSLVMLLRG